MDNSYDNPLIHKARYFATLAHHGQFRRDGHTPYVSHPMAVEALINKCNTDERIVALLHDVLEDSDYVTEGMLSKEFNSTVIDALKAMTHYPDETYEEYLVAVKKNPIARKVKIADILHNLSCDPTKKQIEKYLKALTFLFGEVV